MSEVMENEVKAKPGRPAKAEPAPVHVWRKVKITIHSGEDAGDKGDVFLSHNFDPILIQRDKPVVVDERYLDVLKNSVIETTVKGEDGVVRSIRIPRYAYQVEPA